jgi:hypothetical protein
MSLTLARGAHRRIANTLYASRALEHCRELVARADIGGRCSADVYLAHCVCGCSLHALARVTRRDRKSLRRSVALVEDRRDDRRIDDLLDTLSQQVMIQ